MRITIILGPFLPVPPVMGGAVEKVQMSLAQAYRSAGHDVAIISRRYADFPAAEEVDGIKHLRIPSFDRSLSLPVNLLKDFGYALRAARALPASDITVTNSFSLPLVLPRAVAGKIYVHVARFPKRQMMLYQRADRLQAVSKVVADAIVDQTPALGDRVVTIGNPVAEDFFSADEETPREKTVLYVGRLAKEKGIELLLRAFSIAAANGLEGWKLRIVGPHEVTAGGDGVSYVAELKLLAQRLGIACEFTGPIFDAGMLAKAYRSAAVFVYPSLAEHGEASPLAPLEAMASGCPTVVSDLRCFDDFLKPEVSGIAFGHRGPGAERSLADQLRRLVLSSDLRQKIATQGQESARHFRVEAIASRMLADFEHLLAAQPASTN